MVLGTLSHKLYHYYIKRNKSCRSTYNSTIWMYLQWACHCANLVMKSMYRRSQDWKRVEFENRSFFSTVHGISSKLWKTSKVKQPISDRRVHILNNIDSSCHNWPIQLLNFRTRKMHCGIVIATQTMTF